MKNAIWALEALEAIEAAPLGNARLDALKAHDSKELRYLLNQALSPQITFGMKKLPEPTPTDNDKFLDAAWFEAFRATLKQLEARKLTGNEAKEYIGGFLGVCTDLQRKWSERVIRQDLRLNIGAKDVNNTLGDVIFQFSTPLALDYKKVKEKDLKARFVIEPKLDGARCVAYMEANGGGVTLYSRTGKVWGNFESVRLQLEEVNKYRRFKRNKDVVLDGEVVCFVDDKINFQALQHNLFDDEETGKLKYFVFDLCEREEWESQAAVPYETRISNAKVFVHDSIEEVSGTVFKLGIVDSFVVENPTVAQLESHCEAFTLRGFEGAMARRGDIGIELKRSKHLMKIKTFLDAEAEIIGFAAGAGKYLNQMGALICKTASGVVFELGTGFSDEQRKKMPKQPLIGEFAVYKYKTLTDDGVPFHTSFKGIRHKDDILEASK